MAAGDFDLGKLLQPLSTARFFAEFWEKQPLLLPRHAPDYFAPLLTEADLERLISNTDLRYPAIHAAHANVYFTMIRPACELRTGDLRLGIPAEDTQHRGAREPCLGVAGSHGERAIESPQGRGEFVAALLHRRLKDQRRRCRRRCGFRNPRGQHGFGIA